jgi:hypothetical protein
MIILSDIMYKDIISKIKQLIIWHCHIERIFTLMIIIINT